MKRLSLSGFLLAALILTSAITVDAQEDHAEIRRSLKHVSESLKNFRQEMRDFKERTENFVFQWREDVEEVKNGLDELKEMAINCGCDVDIPDEPARDCYDLLLSGNMDSGEYTITLPYTETEVQVYCDMETDGGGWTVFQRRERFENSDDFNQEWENYKYGFGDVNEEFWLGNDAINALTSSKQQELRVDLWDLDENQASANYDSFSIDDEYNFYQLRIEGYNNFSSDAGDSLSSLNGQNFSTSDSDNDVLIDSSCAEICQGGWWYLGCGASNLNGLNLLGDNNNTCGGIKWSTFMGDSYSLGRTEMKIRPASNNDTNYNYNYDYNQDYERKK